MNAQDPSLTVVVGMMVARPGNLRCIIYREESFKGIRWWNSDYESEHKKRLCENMVLTPN